MKGASAHMCGRYTILQDKQTIIDRFQIGTDIANFEISYNVAPGQNVLAVIHDGTKRRAGYLKWGLVPSWSKDKKIGSKMINARSETAHQKPSFKQLMARKRCIVIADSFYEWQRTDMERIPKRIQVDGTHLFSFAALWDKWEDENGPLFTCTLLTKEANESIRSVHHRMPIILSEEAEDVWLKDSFRNAAEAKQFLDEVDDVHFHYYTVSDVVNNVKHNEKACIEPIS